MTANGVAGFRFDTMLSYPFRHGMSCRVGGAPYLGDVGHSPSTDAACIELNRNTFLRALGIASGDLTIGGQTHGATVRSVTRDDRDRGVFPAFDGFPATDGLVTNDPAVAIGVIIADCVPLVLYDPRRHVVAVVHAGWRGTVNMIAANALHVMSSTYGSQVSDILAGIGPSIGPCCYDVGHDVIESWRSATGSWGSDAVLHDASRHRFDLWTANRLTLLEHGVMCEHIEDSRVCVRCEAARFFSYRASRVEGSPRGRMMMVAQLDQIT